MANFGEVQIIPKAMNLFSTTDDHAGIMLLAIPPELNKGECVFMMSPVSKEGIDSDMGIVVSELKVRSEHKCEVIVSGVGIKLTVFPNELPELTFELDNNFSGRVFTFYNGEYRAIGFCQAIIKKA